MVTYRSWTRFAMAAAFAAADSAGGQSPDSISSVAQLPIAPPSPRLTVDAAHYFRTHPIPLDSVVPGARMRLVAHTFVTERQGIVTAIQADTFVFAIPDKHIVRRILPNDVVSSWVSVGRAASGEHALKIAGLGAIAGTALAQYINGRSYRHDPGFLNGAVVVGVATGAMVGGIVGSLRATDVWRPVQQPR